MCSLLINCQPTFVKKHGGRKIKVQPSSILRHQVGASRGASSSGKEKQHVSLTLLQNDPETLLQILQQTRQMTNPISCIFSNFGLSAPVSISCCNLMPCTDFFVKNCGHFCNVLQPDAMCWFFVKCRFLVDTYMWVFLHCKIYVFFMLQVWFGFIFRK